MVFGKRLGDDLPHFKFAQIQCHQNTGVDMIAQTDHHGIEFSQSQSFQGTAVSRISDNGPIDKGAYLVDLVFIDVNGHDTMTALGQ